MDVLKYGKNFIDGVWFQDVECTGKGNGQGGCGSTLRIYIQDLRYYPGSDSPYSNHPNEAICFRCDICHTITDIDKNLWPHKNIQHPSFSAIARLTTKWVGGE